MFGEVCPLPVQLAPSGRRCSSHTCSESVVEYASGHGSQAEEDVSQ